MLKRSLVHIVAGLAMLLALVTGCRTDVQSGIDQANDLMYRKQYVASERLYRKLLKRLDNTGDLDEEEDAQRLLVLDRLGKVNSLYLHDYTQAIADYQTLLRLYPRTDQAFAARATVADIYHHKLGDLQAAVDAYQKLVADFPERQETRRAQLEIANAYFQLKNYEQARTESEAVINRWPQSPEALQARFQIANSYYVQTRYAEAIAVYERLIEDKPDRALAALVLFELGNCFQELEQPERALAYYYACLVDHPDPMLVQRRIKRVRERTQRARPAQELQLPEYLKERLAASKNKGAEGRRRRLDGPDDTSPEMRVTAPEDTRVRTKNGDEPPRRKGKAKRKAKSAEEAGEEAAVPTGEGASDAPPPAEAPAPEAPPATVEDP